MSLSLAPSSWASLGTFGGGVVGTSASTSALLAGGAGSPSVVGGRGSNGPILSPHYSSIGGGAAPFGPSFDLKMLEKGGLVKSCMRHIKRTNNNRNGKRRPSNGQRSSRELLHPQDDPSAGLSFLFGGGGRGGPTPGHSGASAAAFYHYEGTNRLGKLYCRSGFHLQIHNDGKVNGTRQENSRFGVLEFLSVAFGLVSIKGKESNRYLCMNRRGRLYGSEAHSEECIFMEKMLENYYNTYTSCKYGRGRHSKKKWYVALNKRGRPKRGNQSKKKQKFTQFLVLHLDDEEYKWTRRKFVFANRDTYFGINSFTQEWRRRHTPWERIRTMQHQRSPSSGFGSLSSSSSAVNIPTASRSSTSTTPNNQRRARVRLRRPDGGGGDSLNSRERT